MAQFSRQRRGERTAAAHHSATASALLNNHSCTNNSHPDIYTKLYHQDQRAESSAEEPEGGSADKSEAGAQGQESSPSSAEGGGAQHGRRRHSGTEPIGGGGALARHVWSHQRIARSLSREGFFPTPNEHHPALVRPLAALGDLSAAHPDLPARLHHLAALLSAHPNAQQRQNPSVPPVLSPADAALLAALARLPLPQAGTQALSRPAAPPTASASAPTTPESAGTARWPSISSLNTNAELEDTSAPTWPSRTSSLVSFASLPDDESDDSSTDEEEYGEDIMAGGDLVAPQPHYDHHAYHIYYGKGGVFRCRPFTCGGAVGACVCAVLYRHTPPVVGEGEGEGGKQAGSAVLTLKVSLCYHAPAALHTCCLPALVLSSACSFIRVCVLDDGATR